MKWKIFKILLIIVCLTVLLGALGAVVYVHGVKSSEKYATFDNDKLTQVHSNLTVLDDTGEPLSEAIYYKNIKQVPLSALHEYTYMAFVAVEDKRFFNHSGIDVKRVCGAMLQNIKYGSFKEGASTISQQLIKNTHLDNEKTIERKVNEMLLARELEQNYTKEQILEIYLNTIYFGRNAYGIENAANVYFDKNASQLTIAESAVLAGMIKAPNVYAPDKNIDKCRDRRNLVLELMQQQGIISAEDCQTAKDSEITYTSQKKVAEKTYMYYALKEACSILNMTECQLLNSGYTIETFCNQSAQQYLRSIASNDNTTDKNGKLSDLACLLTDNCGNAIACYMRGENADSRGQVGSTLKPIAVYAPALNEKIITQASPVLDEPTNFNGYEPSNVGGYNGWTTIKQAVTKSLNVPAVKTLNALTLSTAEKYLTKLGFEGKQNLSLALGNIEGGATPFELAKCYTALSNNGLASEVKFVKSIYGNKGQIYAASTGTTQVFKPTTAFLMTDMLTDVVNNGTAKVLKKSYQVAAKTGTVGNKNGNTDALVAGYTTKHTFVVWHRGEFDNKISGANAPCLIAAQILDKIYQQNEPDDFTAVNGVVKIKLDKDKLENHQQLVVAKKGVDFWFDASNKPTEKLEEVCYDYTIKSNNADNGIRLELPTVKNGVWEMWQEIDGKTQKVLLENNSYLYSDSAKCSFYAKLYVDGRCVYSTAKIDVYPKTQDEKSNDDSKGNKNFLDFWYWK